MTVELAPPPSRPQHLRAVERANQVRHAQADLCRRIRGGRLAVPDVLRDPPENIGSLAIDRLLKAQVRWGRARTLRILRAVPVRENKPIRELTERQRLAIAAMLEAGKAVG